MAARATRQQSLAAHHSGQSEAGEVTLASSCRTGARTDDPARTTRKGGRTNRTGQTGQHAASAGSSALKIVLRAPAKHAQPAPLSAPPSCTTSGTSVIVLESSSSSSAATSRAETPAARRPTSSGASPSTPAAPSLDGMSTSDPYDSPDSVRKGQKNGKDGLNRVCHMHKSQTDRPRMTCINAPDCRTVWCNRCVVKHYLACTPNNAFDAMSLFLCPVCLDVCLCAGCKRKRRSSGRRSASADIPDDETYEPPSVQHKKKKRRTSAASDVSMLGVGRARGPRSGDARDVRMAESSDSSDEDASVSRLLTGAAVTTVAAEPEVVAVAVEEVKSTPPASTAAPTQPTLTIKVKPPRRRGSLDCAYDRANPITFRPAPPPPTQYAAHAPLPTPAPSSSSRRRSNGPRPPRQQRPPRPTAAPAPVPDYAMAHGSIFAPTRSAPPLAPTYNSRPIVPTAAATRSRRTKRPSTAFDDYALDSATSSAAGLADRYSPSLEPSLPAARKGRLSSAPMLPKRHARRRYSGLSSASSCDELSSDDDGLFDDAFDDAVPMVVEEQPLPVLAGLEKNLEAGAAERESLTFDEFGLALPLGQPLRARPKVKWIEGPERRRRRAMAAAAAAAAVAGETAVAPAHEAEPPLADPAKPTSPSVARLPLPAPGESLKPFGSRSPSAPTLDKKPALHPSPTEEQPPPYESHFPPPASASAAASRDAPSTAPPGDELRSRSPTDAKLAFALLDAVRAAVAPRDGSSSGSSGSSVASSAGGFGAAIDALFAGSSGSPAKRSAAASPALRQLPADNVDLDAATAEAERRRASLAAAAEVDPGKAFKPLAKDRADAQFFGAPAVPLAGVDEPEEDAAPVVGRRETVDTAASFGFDDVFEFEIGSPVNDLWTPASAADSVGASARSVSTAPSSAFDEIRDRCGAAAGDDGAFFPASVDVDGAEELDAPPQCCVSPTRGLAFDSGVEGILPLVLPLGGDADV